MGTPIVYCYHLTLSLHFAVTPVSLVAGSRMLQVGRSLRRCTRLRGSCSRFLVNPKASIPMHLWFELVCFSYGCVVHVLDLPTSGNEYTAYPRSRCSLFLLLSPLLQPMKVYISDTMIHGGVTVYLCGAFIGAYTDIPRIPTTYMTQKEPEIRSQVIMSLSIAWSVAITYMSP